MLARIEGRELQLLIGVHTRLGDEQPLWFMPRHADEDIVPSVLKPGEATKTAAALTGFMLDVLVRHGVQVNVTKLGLVLNVYQVVSSPLRTYAAAVARDRIRVSPKLTLALEPSFATAVITSSTGLKGPAMTLTNDRGDYTGLRIASALLESGEAELMLVGDLRVHGYTSHASFEVKAEFSLVAITINKAPFSIDLARCLAIAEEATSSGSSVLSSIVKCTQDEKSGSSPILRTIMRLSAAREVAISGIGIVSPYGFGHNVFTRGYFAGESVLRPITRFRTEAFRNRVGGEINESLPEQSGSVGSKFLRLALSEAFADADIQRRNLPERCIAIFPTICGEAQPEVNADALTWLEDHQSTLQSYIRQTVECVHVSATCASVGAALSLGRLMISQNDYDMALILGADALNVYDYASLDCVRALSRNTARPFDEARDGILIGEGAGVVILEPRERIEGRKHTVRAWLAAAFSAVGGRCGDMTSVDTTTAAHCMRTTLTMANVSSVDYIHAHATGTVQGDAAECAAINEVFGSSATPVSSHKGATGHLLRCSGFLGLSSAIAALDTQTVPPTVGLEIPDPICNVIHVTGVPKHSTIEHVMVNTFGLCSNYATVVLRHSASNVS